MNLFQVGDEVECLYDFHHNGPQKGKIYTIISVDYSFIGVFCRNYTGYNSHEAESYRTGRAPNYPFKAFRLIKTAHQIEFQKKLDNLINEQYD